TNNLYAVMLRPLQQPDAPDFWLKIRESVGVKIGVLNFEAVTQTLQGFDANRSKKRFPDRLKPILDKSLKAI
ncbi:hypothetical protein, partial [Microcoleus sp. herbarium12]|uniref:hypothetical protein n=1 Tax=Microcoleus sp. herbarium12 TaxID=3055437 RepID=UPI002FD5E0DE